MALAPGPGAAHDAFQIVKLGFPSEDIACGARVGDKPGGIARAAPFDFDSEILSGDFFHHVDDLFDAVSLAGTKIQAATKFAFERKQVCLCEIGVWM